MKQLGFILFLVILSFQILLAQSGTQNVKGQVMDGQSEIPLIGATVHLVSDPSIGAITDMDGAFTITGAPLGRQAVDINYLGYEPISIPNVEVTAGKEVFLEVAMTESLVTLSEVVITAVTAKDLALNEMATVSSRQFSMEEVNRYSGGRSDVGRLAGNFAGVSTADDSRNDIVIRGNSPTGLLWRLEGIPIPSPNHFGTIGTTGGPVSALNTNLLKNSDFLTSAFPAEYGNALSGVFDIGFRSGNKDKIETTLQVGATTGFEGMIEGPISRKNNSSFLVAYRYSFIGVAQSMGMDVGTNAVPSYQDLSFKLDLGKSPLGNFTVFGIAGNSAIEFLKDEVDATDLFAFEDEDTKADSRLAIVGVKHNFLLSNKSYLKSIISYSGNGVRFTRERYYNPETKPESKEIFATLNDQLQTLSLSSYYNKKFNSRLTARAGVLFQKTAVQLNQKSAEFGIDNNDDEIYDLIEVYNFDASTTLVQPYAQAQFRLNEKLTLNGGLHAQYYQLNDNTIVEPRLALNYQATDKHRFNLGYGLHSQTLPLPMQLSSKIQDGIKTYPNRSLDFTKSNQFVLGHDFKINNSWRSKVEVYYQQLSDVPVEQTSSSFSTLNVGADFGFPIDKTNLINAGTGANKGVEITIEKFFNDNYYMLLTTSIFDSKYTGSDGIERNTAFNNRYVINFLGGTEVELGSSKNKILTLDTKVTKAGGRYYTPVDLEASRLRQVEIPNESLAYSLKYDDYFRFDFKIGIKMNNTKRRLSQGFYLDMQNVLGVDNIFAKSYNRSTGEVNYIYQIGFFPNFIYKIEF